MSVWWWLGLIMVAYLWATWCNVKTRDERQELINWIYDQPDWPERRVALDRVSYGAHLFRRMMFLPWKHLYARWTT